MIRCRTIVSSVLALSLYASTSAADATCSSGTCFTASLTGTTGDSALTASDSTSGGAYALLASSTNGIGIHGETAANDASLPGVRGIGAGASAGVEGSSGSGPGVEGVSTSGAGVLASSTLSFGLSAASFSNHAIHAVSGTSEGVVGEGGSGSGAAGVWGISNGSNGYSLYGSGDMRIVARGSQTGTATKPGGGSWSAPSDARIKKDVIDFKAGLAEIAKIRPVRYKYNGLADTVDNGAEFVGVIAQEVEKVMPSMVTSRKVKLRETDAAPIDLKLVDDTAFTYALINSVNQLSAQNQELQKRLDRLETGKPLALAGLAMDGSVGALGIGVGIGIAMMRARRRSDDLREK